MSIGKAAARTADSVRDINGSAAYPETEFGLAAYLFESIAGAEKGRKDRDRSYYVQLMYECVRTVQAASESRS